MLPQTRRATIVLAQSGVLGGCYVESEVLLSVVTFVICTGYFWNIVRNPFCRIMLSYAYSQQFSADIVG